MIGAETGRIAAALPQAVGHNFRAAIVAFVGTKSPLTDFARRLDAIGAGRAKKSIDVMESKGQVIAELISLPFRIAVLLALPPFTGGASLGQISVRKAIAQVRGMLVLQRLARSLHRRSRCERRCWPRGRGVLIHGAALTAETLRTKFAGLPVTGLAGTGAGRVCRGRW